MKEIVRNMTRRKLRTFLTLSGIVIGVTALTTMGALAENFNALLDGGYRYYGSSIPITTQDGKQGNLLPLAKIDEIKAVRGVAAAFPSYMFDAKPGGHMATFGFPDQIMSSDPGEESFTALKTTLAQGRKIQIGDTGVVVLGYTIAGEFNMKVGSFIDLPIKPKGAKPGFLSHRFVVVGVLERTRTAPDNFAYVSISDAQRLLEDTLPSSVKDTIDVTKITMAINVYGAPGTSTTDLDVVADRINDQVSEVKASRPTDVLDNLRSAGTTFTALTTGVTLLALLIGGLSVINTMIMTVSERTREIGLKKAVGFRVRHILQEYLTEATLIGLIGGVVGYLLGVALTTLLNTVEKSDNQELFLVTPALTVFAIGFAVVLGASAGVIPAMRAARLDPVAALRSTT